MTILKTAAKETTDVPNLIHSFICSTPDRSDLRDGILSPAPNSPNLAEKK